jgi:nitrite reductase/ring-hydroxylating ferredoxin subunit
MAKPEGVDRDRIDDLVDTGLRNLWYPIAPSWMVREAPAGFTRLGLHLVAWRNADGGVHVLEDRCPHRGARLSLGWNRGDRIACWYHGVEIGPDGNVLRVPAVPGCPMEGRHYLQPIPASSATAPYLRGSATNRTPTRRRSISRSNLPIPTGAASSAPRTGAATIVTPPRT